MKRKPSSKGKGPHGGKNHEGRAMFRSALGPAATAFDAGTTLARRSLKEMNAKQQATAQCWCGAGYVTVSLDDVLAGRTESCCRHGCVPPAVSS